MSETGSSEHVANGGMETAIVVVNGADGLTAEMLRVREPDEKFSKAREFAEAFQRELTWEFLDEDLEP